jgi:lauroyl/myristoyl acyltransferase
VFSAGPRKCRGYVPAAESSSRVLEARSVLKVPSALRTVYLRRVVGTILEAAGLEVAQGAARLLARGVWELEGPGRRRAEERLARALTGRLSEAERDRLVQACYEHVGMCWVEALFARRRLRERSWRRVVRLDEEERWKEICGADAPVIFVTGFLGHPGVGAYALGQMSRPVHALIAELDQPAWRAWQQELYTAGQVRLIRTEESLRRLPEVLEAGGKVVLIGEHARTGGKGVEVDYLGRRQRCYSTVEVLARRYAARVVVFGCLRLSPDYEFALKLAAVIEPDTPSLTQAYMSALERLIRAAPEQYMWGARLGAIEPGS